MSISSRLFLNLFLIFIRFILNLLALSVDDNELSEVFEHMAYVEIAKDGIPRYYFSGCIITENMVLVSAEFDYYRSDEARDSDQYVIVGTQNYDQRANTTEIIDIKRLITYSTPSFEERDYKVELPADVSPELSLIVLKSDITMRLRNVSVMPLPQFPFATDYEECVVVGWGNVQKDVSTPAEHSINFIASKAYPNVNVGSFDCSLLLQQKLALKLARISKSDSDNSLCHRRADSQHYRFCIEFPEEKSKICEVGQGSPVVCDGEMIGLVTENRDCEAEQQQIDVRMRICDNIYYYLDWIYSNIEDPLSPMRSSSNVLKSVMLIILKTYLCIPLLANPLKRAKGPTFRQN
uniref:Peptidase S1 domain-containing protein n=1 Tax=Glossina brevipalpis TaxID=37001 RepID=A0A1A9WI27_9MUSC